MRLQQSNAKFVEIQLPNYQGQLGVPNQAYLGLMAKRERVCGLQSPQQSTQRYDIGNFETKFCETNRNEQRTKF